MDVVAPLFGAERERQWDHDWNPRFIWPEEPSDREGMVFAVPHEHEEAVWVNTAYDLAAGRIQYAYVLPHVLATTVTVSLGDTAGRTHVRVRYERTALSDAASHRVAALGEQDANAGPEWQRLIEHYLNASPRTRS